MHQLHQKTKPILYEFPPKLEHSTCPMTILQKKTAVKVKYSSLQLSLYSIESN